MYHKNGSSSRHIFISYDAGYKWMMFDSRIERLNVLNNGGLMFGTQRMSNIVRYSYDVGFNWDFKNISANNLIDIFPLESDKQIVIAAINYDLHTGIYSFFLFDFSNVISISHLMIVRPCDLDDFETYHIIRYLEYCYQGKEVTYMRKKNSAMCIDSDNLAQFTINSCPCFLEDFHWYNYIDPSDRNYYYKDNVCTMDPYSNVTESNKTCQDGGIPLNSLNGYDSHPIDLPN
ncbi:VPS10 domain-containing receptor SorCS3 [Thelohanellus kitauei]|uniref:VPS10 domain-containing receptor SorCS3 n=1 Tax=Thelohanellus kitauei TaxID=669202 RepID=A0A0C2JBX1_THEKT|nr:VPS10 domain-containing receptor SorCS3 [Thelohanellus kitauei]